jgi:hypothetical protein
MRAETRLEQLPPRLPLTVRLQKKYTVPEAIPVKERQDGPARLVRYQEDPWDTYKQVREIDQNGRTMAACTASAPVRIVTIKEVDLKLFNYQ